MSRYLTICIDNANQDRFDEYFNFLKERKINVTWRYTDEKLYKNQIEKIKEAKNDLITVSGFNYNFNKDEERHINYTETIDVNKDNLTFIPLDSSNSYFDHYSAIKAMNFVTKGEWLIICIINIDFDTFSKLISKIPPQINVKTMTEMLNYEPPKKVGVLSPITKVKKDYTVAMLLSRNNENMQKAVMSVIEDNPDEFIVGLDPKLKDEQNIKDLLIKANATIVYQDDSGWLSAVKCWHKILCIAKHTWIRQCDDDDVLMGNTREILSQHANANVGAIHGYIIRPKGKVTLHETKDIVNINDIHNFKGSGRIYNRDAMLKIMDKLDDEPYQDYKIAFWLLNAGYKIVNTHTVMTVVNKNIDNIPEARLSTKSWEETLNSLKRKATHRGIFKIASPIIGEHTAFFRKSYSNIKNDLITTYNGVMKKENYSESLLLKTKEDNDTVVICHWHVARVDILDRWLSCMKKNKADILFHMNSYQDRRGTQLTAGIISEIVALKYDYKYLWMVHCDVLVPPFALEKLKEANKDIITAVVVRPLMNGKRDRHAYIHYEYEDRTGAYGLAEIKSNRNILNKVLPYNKGPIRVYGHGMGCCLFKREFVEKFGFHTLDDFSITPATDTVYCNMLKERDYEMYAHTDVRCKHLFPPVNMGFDQVIDTEQEDDWLKDEWFGWEEESTEPTINKYFNITKSKKRSVDKKNLKVLFLNATGGTSAEIARGLTKYHGVHADCITRHGKKKKHLLFPGETSFRQFSNKEFERWMLNAIEFYDFIVSNSFCTSSFISMYDNIAKHICHRHIWRAIGCLRYHFLLTNKIWPKTKTIHKSRKHVHMYDATCVCTSPDLLQYLAGNRLKYITVPKNETLYKPYQDILEKYNSNKDTINILLPTYGPGTLDIKKMAFIKSTLEKIKKEGYPINIMVPSDFKEEYGFIDYDLTNYPIMRIFMPKLYNMADLVIDHLNLGFVGGAAMESMMCGTLTVAHNNYTELHPSQHIDMTVETFYEGIKGLLNKRDQWGKYALEGHKAILQLNSMKVVADKWFDLFNEILDKDTCCFCEQ